MTRDWDDRPERGHTGGMELALTPQQISQFLQDCVVPDDESGPGIDAEVFYGLYVSWCYLNRKVLVPDHAFRTALLLAGLRPERNGEKRRFGGLRMTGPAATDYILNSYPQDAPHPPFRVSSKHAPGRRRTHSLPPGPFS